MKKEDILIDKIWREYDKLLKDGDGDITNLEEHNRQTWEGVSWMVKLGFALLWGVIIGAMIAMWI